jgi:transketolase
MSAPQAGAKDGFDCRDAFAAALEAVAERDQRIVAVVNDSVGSSKLTGFKKRWPERTVNVGIAEQDMVGVGAGLANGGKIPFVSAAACFLTARALEQIKVDVAYSNTNVKLVGQSPGVGYGELGATHHSIEDMGWLRLLPNLAIVVPSDPWETARAVEAAARMEGPIFIRVSRFPVPLLPRPANAEFRLGHAEVLREGGDAVVIANGVMVHRALAAADVLAAAGVSVRVLNMSSIAPLDREAIHLAAELGAIVTVEEHSVRGGLGGAVAEVVATHRPAHIRMLGFPGFMPTGSAEFLFEEYGLTTDGIAGAVREVIAARDA